MPANILAHRYILAAVAVTIVAATTAAATASAAAVPRTATARVTAPAGPPARMIVLLDQPAAPSGHTAMLRVQRASAMARAEEPAVAAVAATRGVVHARFSLIAGFAASLTPRGVAELRARPDVAAVVPDRLERLPQQTPSSAGPRPLPTATTRVCPSDPAKPQLEPEALSLMRAASDDSHRDVASRYADGAGVRVGVIANGVDVDNPDFRRPDGSPVIVDYRDFTGTGTSAPADAIEAMGDVSSIAAQGNKVFDLSTFGGVPQGCTIRVRGVAPGADVVALKISNGRETYDSAIVQAIDYAVNVAHVDVLNESLIGDPYPDTGVDAVSLADRAAVAAGVLVTAASGDSGRANSSGPPADTAAGSAGIIGVGASTQLRLEQQAGGYYPPTARVLSGNLANLSSSGIPLTGRTVDVVAPGYLGWIDCTDDPARYLDCPSFAGTVDGLSDFQGTSESAPLTAGVAALVIQRYRETHHGTSPTPELVKRIIVSTADDLGAPGDEQGSGQVDALRAVQLAGTVDRGRGTSDDVLITPTQRTLELPQGTRSQTSVTLSNPSSVARTLTLASRRAVPVQLSRQTVHVDDATDRFPTFPFTVGPHVSRIVVTWTFPGTSANYIEAELEGPGGVFVNEANQQGFSNNLLLTAEHARSGTWQLLPEIRGYDGPATIVVRSYRNESDPLATVRLRPRSRTTVAVPVSAARTGGDLSRAVTVADRQGTVLTSVPVTVRTIADLTRGAATLSGSLDGGDGFGPYLAGTGSFLLRVPRHAPALHVSVSMATGGQEVDGYLISPDGIALDQRSNLPPGSTDPTTGSAFLELSTVHPSAGVWRLLLGVNGALAGSGELLGYTARVGTRAAPVSASGLPVTTQARLARGVAHSATVHITNDSAQARAYIVDPRLDHRSTQQAGIQRLRIDAANSFPSATVVVPPETTWMAESLTATGPIAATTLPQNFSFPGSGSDPEVYGTSSGGRLALTAAARQLTNGPWLVLPSSFGAFGPGAGPAISVEVHTMLRTRAFDRSITSTTGDPWSVLNENSGVVAPVVVPAHASVDVRVTITPTATAGRAVSGTLFVDTWDASRGVSGEVAALRYVYTVSGCEPSPSTCP